MIVHDVQQNTEEWLALRAGIPTCSELDALISPEGTIRKGAGVETYLARKLAERWTGGPLAGFGGGAMEQGSIREDEARPYYEFTTGTDVRTVGFVTTDDGNFGSSPDGLLPCGGLEIKCPEPQTHVKYLLDGGLPKDYFMQVHGGMAVTDSSYWTFMSYCRNFPTFILNVKRDDALCVKILEAVSLFNNRLDAAWVTLCRLNDGPPERKKATVRERVAATFPGSQAEEEAMAEWMAQ